MMSNPEEINEDEDFDAQLRGLFQEAEQQIEDRSGAPSKYKLTLLQMFRPMVLGFEAVTRATGENTSLLTKLDKATAEATEAQRSFPELLDGFRELLDQKNGINQRMFDALHEELKGYKDGFLLETIHRPVICDLISVFDDLSVIHRQMHDSASDAGAPDSLASTELIERLKTMEMNIEHNCEFLLEVLARLDVTLMPVGAGKLDKLAQRVVRVEVVEDPEQDMDVVRTCKRGFMWKGRVLRPEEVVMRKVQSGANPSSGARSMTNVAGS